MDFKTVTCLVKAILQIDERARNSDSYLYLQVIKQQAIEKGIDIHKVSVEYFLLRSAAWGFAPFETIRRTRQKIQEKFPELSANDVVQGFRAKNEQAFRDFARGVLNG